MSLQHSAAIEASPNSAIGVPETELRSRASSVGLGMRRERRVFSRPGVGPTPPGFTGLSRFHYFNGALSSPVAPPPPLRRARNGLTGGGGLFGARAAPLAAAP